MTPPEAPVAGSEAGATETPPAVSVCLKTLAKRSQFLAAARGRRQAVPGLVLQGRPRGDGETHIGVGFTCSKKVGNAVQRNRAKRRLRAAAREVLPASGRPGWDYVLIGRAEITVSRPFAELLTDLRHALKRVHGSTP